MVFCLCSSYSYRWALTSSLYSFYAVKFFTADSCSFMYSVNSLSCCCLYSKDPFNSVIFFSYSSLSDEVKLTVTLPMPYSSPLPFSFSSNAASLFLSSSCSFVRSFMYSVNSSTYFVLFSRSFFNSAISIEYSLFEFSSTWL